MPKREGRDLARLLAETAAGDETVVDKLADDSEVPDSMVGFHAQQAVEKLIKAVLARKGVRYERTHNIAYLLRLLEDHELSAPPNGAELTALTPWAVEGRYGLVQDAKLDRDRVRGLVKEVRGWIDRELGLRD